MVIWWSMYIVLLHMRSADECLDLEGAKIEVRCFARGGFQRGMVHEA
jgi:hypothetical protein